MLGSFVKSIMGSIKMIVRQLETIRLDDDKSYLSKIKFNTNKDFPIYTIAKSDVKNIENNESVFRDGMSITGGILLFTSVATAIHALIVDGYDRKALFIFSGIQLGTSFSFLILGCRNSKFKILDDAWKFH